MDHFERVKELEVTKSALECFEQETTKLTAELKVDAGFHGLSP